MPVKSDVKGILTFAGREERQQSTQAMRLVILTGRGERIRALDSSGPETVILGKTLAASTDC